MILGEGDHMRCLLVDDSHQSKAMISAVVQSRVVSSGLGFLECLSNWHPNKMSVAEFVLPQKFNPDRRSPMRWILSHVMRHWWLVITILVGAFGNAALAAAVPVLIGQAFNTVLENPPQTEALKPIALWIAGTQLIRGVLKWGRNFGAELIGQRLERDIREELYIELLGKSMTFHNLQPVGDTMARGTNDVREINLMFNPGINLAVGSINFLLLPLIVALTYHPSLILVPAIFIAAYTLALAQYLGELQPLTKGIRKAFGHMNARLSEALDGIEVLKGHAREDHEIELFAQNARLFRDAFVRQGDVEARFVPLLLLGFSIAAGVLHALFLFRQGLLDVGQVIAYVGLLQLFGFPTFISLFAYSQISSGMASAGRILDLINKETDLNMNPSGYTGNMKGMVELKGVSFAYPTNEPCLRNLKLTIDAGQTIAIVGQTGAGKTSLIKLINGTYDVVQGALLIEDWMCEIGILNRCVNKFPSSNKMFSFFPVVLPRILPSGIKTPPNPKSNKLRKQRRCIDLFLVLRTATRQSLGSVG